MIIIKVAQSKTDFGPPPPEKQNYYSEPTVKAFMISVLPVFFL